MVSFRASIAIGVSLLFVSISIATPVFAAGPQTDPLTTACGTGSPWVIPPNKPTNNPANPTDFGEETLVLNAQGAITLCNCTSKAAETYITVNSAGSGEISSSRLYAGSCIEVGGSVVKIRSENNSTNAFGTYSVRAPAKAADGARGIFFQ